MDAVPTDRRAADRLDATARRTRLRLREVCDEVLASHRVARGLDPVTPSDREVATSMLSQLTPALSRSR